MARIDYPAIGYFLKYKYWQDALSLIHQQVSKRKDNSAFNSMALYHFEQLQNSFDTLEKESYFNEKVANNLFYGLEKEFQVIPYVVPKTGFSLRNFKYFSLPLASTYYAIGLYFVHLTQGFFDEYKSTTENINSYCPTILKYSTKDQTLITAQLHSFLNYRKFLTDVKAELDDTNSKVIIRFDVENYFDELPIKRLLELVSESTKPSTKQEFRFDEITKEEIAFFFSYLSKGKPGIPQSDNNVVSHFLGHLYLVFADLYLEDLLSHYSSIIKSYKIIRYVDDTYLSIVFKPSTKKQVKESFVLSLTSKIADLYYYKLGLKLNSKTKIYYVDEVDYLQALLKSFENVSLKDAKEDTNKKDEDPNEITKKIFSSIVDISKTNIEAIYRKEPFPEDDVTENALRRVFDKNVDQVLGKKENIKQLEELFKTFNFELVKLHSTELITLIVKTATAKRKFKEFLLAKDELDTLDIDLVLQYLCQTNFSDADIIKRLKTQPNFTSIISSINKKEATFSTPGYYALSVAQLRKINKPYIIEQIRLRVVNERRENYSVALNHLLNEMHAICFAFDDGKDQAKSYNATAVVSFLQRIKIPHDKCIKIRNLFDRRNNNQVSHPGNDSSVSWGVSKDEYFDYHKCVGDCIQRIVR